MVRTNGKEDLEPKDKVISSGSKRRAKVLQKQGTATILMKTIS